MYKTENTFLVLVTRKRISLHTNKPEALKSLYRSPGNKKKQLVLYKLCVFYVDRNSKMTTTAGHSFYIGPIVFFYYQVNDTGS
jgi:hypothetical protein